VANLKRCGIREAGSYRKDSSVRKVQGDCSQKRKKNNDQRRVLAWGNALSQDHARLGEKLERGERKKKSGGSRP